MMHSSKMARHVNSPPPAALTLKSIRTDFSKRAVAARVLSALLILLIVADDESFATRFASSTKLAIVASYYAQPGRLPSQGRVKPAPGLIGSRGLIGSNNGGYCADDI